MEDKNTSTKKPLGGKRTAPKKGAEKPEKKSIVKKSKKSAEKLTTKSTVKLTAKKTGKKSAQKTSTQKKKVAKKSARKKVNVKAIQSETHAMIQDVILPKPMNVQSQNIKSMSSGAMNEIGAGMEKLQSGKTKRRTHTLRQEVIGLVSVALVGLAFFVIMSSAYISTVAEIDSTESTSSIIKPYAVLQRSFHAPIGQINFSYPDDYGVTGVGSDTITLGNVDTLISEPISIQVHTHESPSLFDWMKNYTPQFKEFTVLDPNAPIKEWGGVWFDATIENVTDENTPDAETTKEFVRGVLYPYNDTTIIEIRLTSDTSTFSVKATRALDLIMKNIVVTPSASTVLGETER